MQISIKGTGLDLTPSLETYIQEKLGTLEKFLKKFDELGAVEMRVEVARTTRHHRHGDVFMAEANLALPGKLLRAVADDADVRTAVDNVKSMLKLEIEKYKTRLETKTVRRAKK
ncbi:MAG TPA: ribosome-associated translation inhibitor RaiA [Candidatus Paceibacterota bacterium]|nr:ribosome-associated translation inhibitor RaiA [Candidatus Paceibacterota bacterium]